MGALFRGADGAIGRPNPAARDRSQAAISQFTQPNFEPNRA